MQGSDRHPHRRRPRGHVYHLTEDLTRTQRRLQVGAARRRSVAIALAVCALLGAALLTQPRLGSYSAFEDPRPGGIARLLTGNYPGQAELPRGDVPPAADDLPTPPDVPDAAEEAELPPDAAGASDGGEGGPIWHVVQAGDTLSGISETYGVSVSDLWITNRLLNPNSLRPGQSLLVPSEPGDVYGRADGSGEGSGTAAQPPEPVFHTVRNGDNLWTIASRYGVTVGSIAKANNLPSTGLIRPGEELEIPGASGAAAGRAVSLQWPVFGSITSPFGMRSDGMHEGLDIAAPRGTEVRAAAGGKVTRAGRMGNYGLALIVDHGTGLQTLYAHCDQLIVGRGQTVEAGQKIATVGSTGRSTGPHLHFEVILNGQRRDPLRYLLAG